MYKETELGSTNKIRKELASIQRIVAPNKVRGDITFTVLRERGNNLLAPPKLTLKPPRVAVKGSMKTNIPLRSIIKDADLPKTVINSPKVTPVKPFTQTPSPRKVFKQPSDKELSRDVGISQVSELISSREGELRFTGLLKDIQRIITFGLGGIRVLKDRPIVLLLPRPKDDSYVHSLAIICRELYRIAKGGKPTPHWITEVSKDLAEDFMRAEGRIFVIDGSELLPKYSGGGIESITKNKLLERIYELFSQGLGFIVFHGDVSSLEEFKEYLRSKGAKYFIPEVIDLSRHIVSRIKLSDNVKRELASMLWGFVKVMEGRSFDEIFAEAERRYYMLLEEVSKDIELRNLIKIDPNAGFEHRALKMVVAEALAKELICECKSREEIIELLKQGVVDSECELSLTGGRADLCVRQGGITRYVEIETLYGTGDPIDKLDKETLSKYIGIARTSEVGVVLLGLHLILYLEDIIKLRRIYRREYGVKVEFYTVDIRNKSLIPLREIIEKLENLSRSTAYDYR